MKETLEERARTKTKGSVKCANYGCGKKINPEEARYIAQQPYCPKCYISIMQED